MNPPTLAQNSIHIHSPSDHQNYKLQFVGILFLKCCFGRLDYIDHAISQKRLLYLPPSRLFFFFKWLYSLFALAVNPALDWTVSHGRVVALSYALFDAPKQLFEASDEDGIVQAVINFSTNDRVSYPLLSSSSE